MIKYNDVELNKYFTDLGIIRSLSRLFSESAIPYLHYRIAENLYCSSMYAQNLSRADVSIDAKKDTTGIAIKTFIDKKNRNLEKIAEFNKELSLYNTLNTREKVLKIASLRNKRIEFTLNAYGIKKIYYHCISRDKKGFHLFEKPMNIINTSSIKIVSNKNNVIEFMTG